MMDYERAGVAAASRERGTGAQKGPGPGPLARSAAQRRQRGLEMMEAMGAGKGDELARTHHLGFISDKRLFPP